MSRFAIALLVFGAALAVLATAELADAGKFKPVEGEDWPESGETNASTSPKGQDDEESGQDPSSGGLPKIRMLEDGTPDPESLKDFMK